MRVRGQKCDPFLTFFLFVTQGGISHENKKTSFPFSSIGIKYVGSFVGLHIACIQFQWLFALNVGFSWPNSIRHICYIVVPMISLVELVACTKTKFSKRWEILSWLLKSWVWWVLAPPCLWDVRGSPWRQSSSIIADLAAIYDEVASASHRCGYFENAVSSSSALAAL
jgi:hypothetical protein